MGCHDGVEVVEVDVVVALTVGMVCVWCQRVPGSGTGQTAGRS